VTKRGFYARLLLVLAAIAILAFFGIKLYALMLNLIGAVRSEGEMERTLVYEDSLKTLPPSQSPEA